MEVQQAFHRCITYQIWFIWDRHGQMNNQIGLVVAGGHMGCLCLVVLQFVDSYRRVDGVEGGAGRLKARDLVITT